VDVLDIARWQFGITTVYHFLMVPLTIGLGLLVAVMHSLWVRTGTPEWLRMTRFWGRIYLINFALGVATGLVQEFQFGLAWSEYSIFVGDVFGSLLALEALLPSSSSRRSSACGSSAGGACRKSCISPRSGPRSSARSSARTSSSRPTRGCSTRWVSSPTTRPAARARSTSSPS
jgi:hypothetical protein